MARYLVTGGCGFIGSHLVDALLRRGDGVVVLDDLSTGRRANLDPRAELLVGDAAEPDLVGRAMAGCDGCFHLAAIASVERGVEDWLGTHRANQTAAVTVFDAARRAGRIPVVYASSAAVYGDSADCPLAETAPTRPVSAYGADKLGCELHGRVAWLSHGVPTVGLRFFNVYGPRQDPRSPYSGVIAIFAGRIAVGQGLTIHGDGGQTRDFIFVGDVVSHLLAAMAGAGAGAEVLNVCTGRGTSVLDLAGIIAGIAGRRPAISHGPVRPGDVRISIGSPAAAIARLGLAATVSVADGLALTLDTVAAA
ncbi:MAG: NAD-dependent epimerase/dehydratase family protein [Thalassobaculales bacterium]